MNEQHEHTAHAQHDDHMEHSGHEMHGEQARHDGHGGHAGHGGHGNHAAQFKDRFWISLALAVPVVFFSEMFADLLGYARPDFGGSGLIAPVFGTVIFLYGGQP